MSRLGDAVRRVVGGPLRMLVPKNPWLRLLLFGIPILLLLALLEPVLDLFGKLLELGSRTLVPLLETPGGRLLVLNVLLVLGVSITLFVLRSRIRTMRAGLILRRHLAGIGFFLQDDLPHAREQFKKVARSRASAPSEFQAIKEDAKLKLARLSLRSGSAAEAVGWLMRIKDRDLPKELRRGVAQVRADSFRALGDFLPQTVEADLRSALAECGDDTRMLTILRELAEERGDLDEVVAIQERVHRVASARTREEARLRLTDDLARAGERALERGDFERARGCARRAEKLAPESPEPGCLMGRVLAAAGDARAAIRVWGATRSVRGLELVAELLDRQPGVVTPRELLEACPVEGAVLLAAREYARQGDVRRAERAARSAAKRIGLTPSTAAMVAEILELCGRSDDASMVCREATRRLLAPESGAS